MLINRKIPGQLREEEQFSIALLAKLVPTNGKIVEVGSLLGRSSWLWAQNADPSVTVFCIDPWEKTGGGNFQKLAAESSQVFSFQQFKINTSDCPNINPMQGFSPKDFSHWHEKIDLYFEDAVHTDPTLGENIRFWGERLKPNGILCGHDFVEKFPDVQRHAREAAAATNRTLHVIGSLWFILPEELEASRDPRIARIVEQLRELESYEATLPPPAPNEPFIEYTKRIVGQIKAFDYQLAFASPIPASVAMGQAIELTGTVTNISGHDWPASALGTAFLKLGAELRCGTNREKVAIDRFWFDAVTLKNQEPVAFRLSLNTNGAKIGLAEIYVDLVYDHITWFEQKGSGSQRLQIDIRPGLEFQTIDHTLDVTDPHFWQQYVPEFNPQSDIGITVASQQNYVLHTSRGDVPTKSMLTTYELAMLHALARDYYSGAGEIVDLGTLLGVGTHVMARGLANNPTVTNKTKRIFSHDLYLMEHQSHFLPQEDAGNTGSVFWRFMEINRDYLDMIVPSPGDVTKFYWRNAPIEILFIDLAKSWNTNAHLLKTHFPYLIPGKSIIIQQDYVHAPEPWVSLTMELLRDYFELLYFVFGASAVYRLKKPIPYDLLTTDLRKLPVAEISRMFGNARQHGTNAIAQVLKCCEAWILAEHGEFAEAARLLDSVVLNASDGTDISRNFAPIIRSNLNSTRKQIEALQKGQS